MKEFINDAMVIIKVICTWLFGILVTASILLNFWFAAVIRTNNDSFKENAEYLKYRDSIQLELMDRITDKNNTVRK